VGLLCFFKYWNFLWNNIEALIPGAHRFPSEPITLPIGISFFTFQALSYVIDVHRGDVAALRNPIDFGLYKSLFPQLIAGPIVRYRDIAVELASRSVNLEGFARGVRRFVVGLGKKILIANVLAAVADQIFALDPHSLDAGTAWLGTICYTAQIYFDFSGYSDMAIGLGLMFGFHFLENFNYPYIARSITDFWRRWHISLSSWFRDYLYISLGGNRRGAVRTYVNLLVVFFLCGLWHGAAWNFVVWGIFHGVFLVIERVVRGARRESDSWIGLPYTLLVVMTGWVFFRAPSLAHALEHLRAMSGFGSGDGRAVHAALYLDKLVWTALIAAAIGSTQFLRAFGRWRERRRMEGTSPALEWALEFASVAAVFAVLLLASMRLSAGTYNPFIYFRF
jgi:alginate O-acetyltransferase complex protein AlgI